jgi:hypothetical protein
MKSEDIEIAVARHWGIRANVIVPRASWGAGVHECDMLILSLSGYLTEIEIKISKGDIKKDAAKRHAHASDKIKKLYFALPENLFWRNGVKELIPEKAGILLVSKNIENRYIVSEDRKPVINERARPATPDEQFQLARLAALRIWDLKARLQKIRHAMQ